MTAEPFPDLKSIISRDLDILKDTTDFSCQLPACFSENLTTLRLYFRNYWGFMPVTDLGTLPFLNLRTLGLARYCFGCRWQLESLVSYQELQTLILYDCAIPLYIQLPRNSELAADLARSKEWDRRPLGLACPIFDNTSWRWADCFNAITQKLPRLRSCMPVSSEVPGYTQLLVSGVWQPAPAVDNQQWRADNDALKNLLRECVAARAVSERDI